MNEELLLEIKNLCIDFQVEGKTTTALNHVNLSIRAGDMVALVGESGSGKSITALSITQLLPTPPAFYSNGEILFHSRKAARKMNMLNASEKELNFIRGKEIGFVFQEPMTSLNPLLTCGEQVAEVLTYHLDYNSNEAKQETLRWFQEVKLPEPNEIFSKYPHELSGGQKQRVMIAIALCCKPSLLIADEPTTALDPGVQKNILDLLKELQLQYHIAILFITHDLNLVRQYANHIAVMHQGIVIESAPTEQLLHQPQEMYTKSLLACRASADVRVKRLSTIQDLLEEKKREVISKHDFKEHVKVLEKNKIVLSAQQVTVSYPTHRNLFGKPRLWKEVVHQVSFDLRLGETLGLIGESGCGKSTLGKALVQLVPLHNGQIIYEGKNIKQFTKKELKTYRREVQVIFQDPYSSLNPRITIGEALVEAMTVHSLFSSKSERKSRAILLLEKVGLLSDHYHRYPHEFSGGQRQRICIARALALQPKVIICDESVSALDVSVQAQVLNLLSDLKDEFELSYLFISHDMAVVKHISDHIFVMENGRKIEYNDAETLYAQPKESYTKSLISSSLT